MARQEILPTNQIGTSPIPRSPEANNERARARRGSGRNDLNRTGPAALPNRQQTLLRTLESSYVKASPSLGPRVASTSAGYT